MKDAIICKWYIKNRKTIDICGLLIFAVAVTVYYGLVHRGHWPDPEQMMPLVQMFFDEKRTSPILLNVATFIRDPFFYLSTYLAKQMFGVNYTAVIFDASFRHFFIILFLAVLALWDNKESKVKWYLMPLFFFLLGIVNNEPTMANGYYVPFYHQCNYDLHITPIFWTCLGLVVISVGFSEQKNNSKLLMGLVTVIIIVGMVQMDAIYPMIFVVPLFVYLFFNLYNVDKKRALRVLCALVAILALFRCISLIYKPLGVLFSTDDVIQFYGQTQFNPPEAICDNIFYVLEYVLALYNINFASAPLISLNTIVMCLRFIFVMCILKTVFKCAKGIVAKEVKNSDAVSIIASIGIMLNIIFCILTPHGSQGGCGRYLTAVYYLGSMVYIRNIKLDNLVSAKMSREDVKRFFFLFACLLCIISANAFWIIKDNREPYKEMQRELVELIKNKKLGNGLANHWTASTLTVLLGDGSVVYPYDGFMGVRNIPSDMDTDFHFVISGEYLKEEYDWFTMLGEEEIVNTWGEADSIYELSSGFRVYYYNEPLIF